MTARKRPELRVLDAEPPVSPDIIERLTEVCKLVEDDKVSSVAIAIVYRDGSSDRCWSNAPSLSCLIGAVTRLQHALIGFAEE